MLGTTATGKGFFGGGNLPWTAQTPTLPDLDFFNQHSWLSTPFYHFMADWDQSSHSGFINFEKLQSYDNLKGPVHSQPRQEAKVGDYVRQWKNTWLAPGQGDAIVTEEFHFPGSIFAVGHTGVGSNPQAQGSHTYFQFRSFPTVVAKEYNGRVFKGLQFTGTEFLTIKGSTVVDVYGQPGPMFSTGGASWAGNTGATFIMVIDQDPYRPPYHWQQEKTSQVQSLLYSRSPGYYDDPAVADTGEMCANWMEESVQMPGLWPESEYMGVQYFRNVKHQADLLKMSMQAFGPNGTTIGTETVNGFVNTSEFLAMPPAAGHLLPCGNAANFTVNDDYGGSDWRAGGIAFGADNNFWDNPYGLESSPEFVLNGPLAVQRTHEGFQVILLEYDNVNQVKYEKDPIPSQHEFGQYRDLYERDYTGPAMKIYGMSNHFMPSWRGLDLTYPKLKDLHPALANHTLFDRGELQLGGLHPYHHGALEYGNGFRGVIFEVMMLEGTLSTADKLKLQEHYIRKYAGALVE